MNRGKTRFQGSSKPKFFPAWAQCACDSNVSKVAVLCVHRGLAGCSAGHTHGMGGPGGAVPPPGEEWGSCPSAQPWRIPLLKLLSTLIFHFFCRFCSCCHWKAEAQNPLAVVADGIWGAFIPSRQKCVSNLWFHLCGNITVWLGQRCWVVYARPL